MLNDLERQLRDAVKSQRRLIEDMSRFVGQMTLKDYALFNEAPIDAAKALAEADQKESQP